MVYKYIQKWVGILVVSLGVISLSSSLQASFGVGGGEPIHTPANQAYKLQKTLPSFKAQAH